MMGPDATARPVGQCAPGAAPGIPANDLDPAGPRPRLHPPGKADRPQVRLRHRGAVTDGHAAANEAEEEAGAMSGDFGT
jgi:hypothetical protein